MKTERMEYGGREGKRNSKYFMNKCIDLDVPDTNIIDLKFMVELYQRKTLRNTVLVFQLFYPKLLIKISFTTIESEQLFYPVLF